ncbi:MAG: hypothetical protein KDB27_22105 [Planctomycetales bacterium]|nr:hypothetical protein [Planctomycetales bacterium]
MSRQFVAANLLATLLILLESAPASAEFTNSYSYTQENKDSMGGTVPYSDSGSSMSANFVEVTKTPTNSTLKFDAISNESSDAAATFSMGSRAGIDAVINAPANAMLEQFEKLTSQASAVTMVSDTVEVTGLPNGTTGFILFDWTLTGNSTLSAAESSGNAVLINGISAKTTLSVTVAPEAPFMEEYELTPSVLGLNNSSTTNSFSAPPGSIILPVAFTAGSTVDVDFLLKTEAFMNIDPVDPLGFQFDADVSAQYESTAVLNGVLLIDDDNNPLVGGVSSTIGKGAYNNVTAVPEPSPFLCGIVLSGIAAIGSLIRRRIA